jgi:hypothetical protein
MYYLKKIMITQMTKTNNIGVYRSSIIFFEIEILNLKNIFKFLILLLINLNFKLK